MITDPLSRREFLSALGMAAKTSAIALTLPMIMTACRQANEQAAEQTAPGTWKVLSEEQALEFDAMTARIVPSDGTPGAREAGTVRFMDTVLADGREAQFDILKDGLTQLQAAANNQFSGSKFHQLNEAQQDQLLRSVETTPFFSTLRFLTVASLFALPQYGGTGPDVGYGLIGMPHAHAYVPPFGHYDADYIERGE